MPWHHDAQSLLLWSRTFAVIAENIHYPILYPPTKVEHLGHITPALQRVRHTGSETQPSVPYAFVYTTCSQGVAAIRHRGT